MLSNPQDAGGTIRPAAASDMPALARLCAEHATFERADPVPDDLATRLTRAMFSPSPRVRCLLAEHMAAEGLPVEVCCRVLDGPASGYHAWRNRPLSQRALRHAWSTEQIRGVHQASRGTYGSRRVHAELRLGRGLVVGYHAVEMLMRRAGIRGLPGSRRPGQGTRSRPPVIWSTATSPDRRRTSCGSPTSPSTRPEKARCTARSCWTSRPGPIDGNDRRLLRQRHDRVLLGPDADRTAQTQALAHPHRTGQRDLRVPGDLPQPATPPQLARHAHPDRV
ncbi:transposase [Micromonospora sp. KC606]|nr:transposase [Micromonospora sp. KC606]